MGFISGIANNLQGYSTGVFQACMPVTSYQTLNVPNLFETYKASLNKYNAFTPEKVFGKDYAQEFKEKTKASYEPLNKEISQTFVNSNLNKFGQANANKIKELQPDMQVKTLKLLEYAESKGLKVTITSGFRTQEQQQHLLQTRPKYAAKNSLHCLGRAIDISIEGKKDSDYVMLGEYAKSIGMRWGGDFKNVRERWHFDIGRA